MLRTWSLSALVPPAVFTSCTLPLFVLLLFLSVGLFSTTESLSLQRHGMMKMASSSPAAAAAGPKKIVIVAGSGVIGTSTAFFLAKDFGVATTLVDPTGTIAPAASGKAGGFLALDWNDHSSVGPLTRRSFALHQEIADLLGADKIQYRRLTCASIRVGNGSGGRPQGRKLEGIEWAEGDNAMANARSLGDESTIAQVHPKKLCESMWEHVQSLTQSKSSVVKGSVVEAVYEERDDGTKTKFVGAKLDDGTVVEGDALLYACGPWTANNMFGTKYHSLVVPTSKALSQCVFFSGFGDPEVYVRPDNTAYCTGFPDPPMRVTERPGQEEVRNEAIAKIQQSVEQASSMSGDLMLSSSSLSTDDSDGNNQVLLKQACYLPSTMDGTPMMGPLLDQPNAFVCTGHTCWGILMGPASGEAMANLIVNGDSPHVDLSSFDPARFGTLAMVPQASIV